MMVKNGLQQFHHQIQVEVKTMENKLYLSKSNRI